MNNDGLRAFVAASREWSDSLETHLDHQLLDLDLDLGVAPNPEPDLDLGVAPNPEPDLDLGVAPNPGI